MGKYEGRRKKEENSCHQCSAFSSSFNGGFGGGADDVAGGGAGGAEDGSGVGIHADGDGAGAEEGTAAQGGLIGVGGEQLAGRRVGEEKLAAALLGIAPDLPPDQTVGAAGEGVNAVGGFGFAMRAGARGKEEGRRKKDETEKAFHKIVFGVFTCRQ